MGKKKYPTSAIDNLIDTLQAILDSENGATLLDGGSILGAGLRELAQDAISQAKDELY